MKIRSSNFELLRIFAMFIIIFAHLAMHGFYEIDSNLYFGDVIFNKVTLYSKLAIPDFFLIWGNVGNFIFISLTGYFLINASFDAEKNIKKIMVLFAQATWAFIILFSVSIFAITMNLKVTSFVGEKSLSNGVGWFLAYYVGVLALSPLFNKFLLKLNKDKTIYFLIVLFAVTSFPTLNGPLGVLKIQVLMTGFLHYSIGAAIKRFNLFSMIKSWLFVLILMLISIIHVVSDYLVMMNKINHANPNATIARTAGELGVGMNSVWVPILGVCLFVLFSRIPQFSSRVINYVASSIFVVYLLHDQTIVYQLIARITNLVGVFNESAIKGTFLFVVINLAIFAFGVFAFSIFSIVRKLFKSLFLRFAVKNA